MSEPCLRCQQQPVCVKLKSYWRAYCPNHSGMTQVAGHTMRTKNEALEQWDHQMRAAASIASQNAGEEGA